MHDPPAHRHVPEFLFSMEGMIQGKLVLYQLCDLGQVKSLLCYLKMMNEEGRRAELCQRISNINLL